MGVACGGRSETALQWPVDVSGVQPWKMDVACSNVFTDDGLRAALNLFGHADDSILHATIRCCRAPRSSDGIRGDRRWQRARKLTVAICCCA